MCEDRRHLWKRIGTCGLSSSFALLFLFGCLSDVVAQTQLRVGIIGDQTSSTDIQKSYQVLSRGIEILSKENVKCVLHTGDLLESSVSPEEYRAQFAQATNLLDKLGRPWHLTAGDHDVNPPQFIPNSTDRSRETLYRELYRQREPRLTNTLNHSFDVNGYHFIALNSQEHLHTDPRWGDVFLDSFTAEQYNWLKDDLAKHQNAKGIIVFIHQPMWYYWSGWMLVHQLLRRYPVLAVIAGHFHYDQDEGELDNIRYIVVGSTGGIVKEASRDAGNVQHVTVLTITGRKVEFRLIPVDGSGPLQITPRVDMDRVQAVATVLGELFGFGAQNPLCLKDNKLYGNNGQAPKLSLVPVGNPIDLPVTVRLQLQGDKLSLLSPHFTTGVCQQTTADGACVLAPAARIESSNTSSVVLNDRFAPLPALWESGLAITSGSTVVVGEPVELKVRLSFPSSQGNLFVEANATTKITACP
jgi:DNA repair exonuclease SbcCD nuclease subunit